MKAFSIIILAALFSGVHASNALCECYGEAAAAYGCGAPVNGAPSNGAPSKVGRPVPSLERFGSDDGPVLPDTGHYYHGQGQNGGASDVITDEERQRMLRDIVLGRGGSARSNGALANAVDSAARPVRRSGAMPARTR
ncbi:MAG: hypothetical protein ACK5GN_12515 [Pseudomonadota bacterium]|jgi:hypothetical protein